MTTSQIRWFVLISSALVSCTDSAFAEEKHERIAFKISGVMRSLAPGSSKFCYVRLTFQNRGTTAVIVPFEFASPRRPQKGQPFVSLEVEHGNEGNASNLTTCATATCEWSSISGKRTSYRSVARILNRAAMLQPNETDYCTIETPRPPKDSYKLRVHFDNRTISKPTKMLADFNAYNPQFFAGTDEVEVQVK